MKDKKKNCVVPVLENLTQVALKLLWRFIVGKHFTKTLNVDSFLNLSHPSVMLISIQQKTFNLHRPAPFRGQIHFRSLVLLYWSQLSIRYCAFPPPPHSSANHFPQQPQRQIWQISIYGTCVAVACLIRSKQALIWLPISVSPRHKFQVGNWFLSRVEGFTAISLPFICTYVCVRLRVYVCACSCMCMCLCPLSVCGFELSFVCVCRCYLSNWI